MSRPGGRIAIIPVTIALVLHLLVFLGSRSHLEVDSASYLAQAESLVARGAALDAGGQPDTIRTPGYPLFLALFLATPLGVRGAVAAQHVLWVVLVAATVRLTWRASRNRIAALSAGVILAIDIPGLQSANAVLTETLAAAFVFAAVWQAFAVTENSGHATWRSAAAGALAGWSAIVRPVAVLLGIPLALAIALGAPRGVKLKAAAVAMALFCIFPLLWTARNYRETGFATISSIGGINLLRYRAAGTLAIRDPGGLEANLPKRQQELEQAACADLERIYGRPCRDISMAAQADHFSALAMPIIIGDPVASTQQAARAFAMIVFGGGANMLAGALGISEAAARLICLGYTVPLAALAALGLAFWWRRNRQLLWLVLLVVGYLVGMSLGAEAYSRFRVPVLPLYAMLGGGGIAFLVERFSGSDHHSFGAP